MHDTRCEASWNDGLCACQDRADNLAHGRFRPADPAPVTFAQRVARRLALHR